MSNPEISVVISARDSSETIAATLDGLLAQQDAPPFEVVVVDNGSNDDTPEIVARHPLGARLIRRQRGEGPGVARNEGAAASDGRLLAFTDADCAPSAQWLREGARAAEEADIVQGAVRPTQGQDVGPYDRTLFVGREYGLYETANLFVRREWFDKAGGFADWVNWDEDGQTRRMPVPDRPFGEDAWFVWRARRLGARTTFSNEALVHHAVFAGDVKSFVAEQVRLRHFPALLARIPELRDIFVWRRYFLNKRTAAFDVALFGLALAVVARSRLPLATLLPYLVLLYRETGRFRLTLAERMRYAGAVLARDAVGCVALIRGSVESRSPLF
jgi:hypothetical protein